MCGNLLNNTNTYQKLLQLRQTTFIRQRQFSLCYCDKFIKMQRLEQRVREKIEQDAKIKQQKQLQALKRLLQDDEVRTIFQYCRKVLSEPLSESLSEYSPVNLSKFVFEEQLQHTKKIIDTLPGGQAKIEHFLLIMIKVMNLPFEKWPYYLIGFKDMFNQIVLKRSKTITYQQFFKYVIGEVLDFKEEQNNTQFQVRFQELKKQDNLLHDNGVKKFYYSLDLKCFFTLDESSYMIKIYNKQMKIIAKFTPNKDRHGKKLPQILWFDYSQMTNRMGIVLSDSTLSIINMTNFFTKSKAQFDINPNNEIVVAMEQKMLKIFYIQMLNRWAMFTEENKFLVFDLQKHRQNDPLHLVTIKVQNPDLILRQIVQLVNLSTTCVIAANEIYFYNQSFTEIKHSRFSHSSNISNFHYCEQTGNYYICGEEKDITIFNIPRGSRDNFKIWTFGTQMKYKIKSFEIFPAMNTLVLADESHQVRVYDLSKSICYQATSYAQIVKNQDQFIKTIKISKTQFGLYETYTLLLQQEKIAIEKDTEFNFLAETYYDELKQQFFFSVNNQIISFSIPQGQIRKSYNQVTANVPKHLTFKLGKNTDIFIIDDQKYIYEAYLKDLQPEGQNKYYKKKINVPEIIQTIYDEDIQYAFVVGSKAIFTIRNDKMNNFTVISSLTLEDFAPIILSKYNSNQKQIIVLMQNQSWCTIDPENYKILSCYSYIFPLDLKDHEDVHVIQFEHNPQYSLDILLTNKNQIYLISSNRKKQYYLKFGDELPRKLRSLQFVSMKYFGSDSQIGKHYLLFCDKTGFLLQLNISKIISANFSKQESQLKSFNLPVKDSHNIVNENFEFQKIDLKNRKIYQIQKKDILYFKAHDKQIKIAEKIMLQGYKTLSISVDGHIKLWNEQKCLFELKMPDLKKIGWNMKEIQSIKNQKSVQQAIIIFNTMQKCISEKKSPQMLLKYSSNEKKQMSLQKQLKKFSLDQPIPIEIQNKDIEDIIQKTQQINWYSARSDNRRKKENNFSPLTSNYHPWRTKNSFVKIMDKASPENKYQRKMPFDLVNLRTSLDMKDRRQISAKKEPQKKQLFILPELNTYVSQKQQSETKLGDEEKQIEQNEQTFQSCLYVKKGRNKKKINEFDEIDKQFKKKWMVLTAKKWVPTRETRKKVNSQSKNLNKTSKTELYNTPIKQHKYDPLKEVKQLFQNHNRQAAATKRGRFIKIPELNLRKMDIFSID